MNNNVLVKNILSLPSLEGAEIIAGSSHADNPITNIAVMEVPDVSEWVQPGEFLITTGYMFKDDIEGFVNIIPELQHRNVAALGLKPNRFINKIPKELIKAAEKHGLPLIYLPPHTNFSKVTSEVMEKILVKDIITEDYLIRKLIKPTHSSIDSINEYAKTFHINFTKDTYIRLLTIPMTEDFVYSSLKQTVNSLFFNTKIRILTTRQALLMGIVCIYEDEEDWDQFERHNYTYIEQIMSNYNVNLFIGNPQKGFSSDSKLNDDMMALIKLSSVSNNQNTIISWDKIGLLSVVPSIYKSPYHVYLYHTYIKPIREYDQKQKLSLYDTLKEYIACNGNMKLAAENMYIHYNTMCYRINKVKEDFSWNLNDISTLTDLNLAFILETYSSPYSL